MLWQWIVGLTDLMVHCKSGELEYSEENAQCNDEVTKLHPSKHNQQQHLNQEAILEAL